MTHIHVICLVHVVLCASFPGMQYAADDVHFIGAHLFVHC